MSSIKASARPILRSAAAHTAPIAPAAVARRPNAIAASAMPYAESPLEELQNGIAAVKRQWREGLERLTLKRKYHMAPATTKEVFDYSYRPPALDLGALADSPAAEGVFSDAAPAPLYIRPLPNIDINALANAVNDIRIPAEATTKLAKGWVKLDLSAKEVCRIKQTLKRHNGAGLELKEGEMPADAI